MKTVKLGDYVNITNGYPFKSTYFNSDGNGLLVIRIQDMNQGFSNQSKYWNYDYDENFVIDNNDILISLSGSFKVERWQYGKALLNQRIIKINPVEGLHKSYMYYILKRKLDIIKSKATQTSIANISVKDIKNLEIPLPDLETQKAIADKLEKIENLIEQKKQVIQKTDELTKSTFIDMFGDPYLNPKGWESEKIKDVIYSAQYGTSKKATEDKGSGSIGVLRMNNITYNGDIDLTELKYVNFDNEKDYDKYTLEKGDILFNRTNSKELVGKTAVYNYDDTLSFAGYLVRLKVNYNLVLPIYISSFLNSEYGKKVLYSMAKNIVGMANINAKEVQSIKLPIPPLELQQKFADIVSKIEQQKQQHQQSLEKLQELYNATLQESFRF